MLGVQLKEDNHFSMAAYGEARHYIEHWLKKMSAVHREKAAKKPATAADTNKDVSAQCTKRKTACWSFLSKAKVVIDQIVLKLKVTERLLTNRTV